MKNDSENRTGSTSGSKGFRPHWLRLVRVIGRRNRNEAWLLFFMSAVIGFIAGTGAWLLKLLIKVVSRLLTSGLSVEHINWILLPLPILGLILTLILTKYLFRRDIAHGVEHIRHDVKKHRYRLSPNLIWQNIVAASATIGFGGSAGAEGPIAYSGAAAGSSVGRFFMMSPAAMRTLIGIGAGAGIAGIFKSPVGGIFFVLEVLEFPMTTMQVMALAVACVIASLSCFVFSGFTPDVVFHTHYPMEPRLLWIVILMAVFCGLYSVYYTAVKDRMDKVFKRISSTWIRVLMTGLSLSVCIFLFPSLYGEGYGVATDLINGQYMELGQYSLLSFIEGKEWLIPVSAAAILLVKSALVSAATNGGVAGEFAPTLFAGSVAGFLFAYMANLIFGCSLPVGHFAVAGMAAVMAGTIHAPLMAIFIVVEMSQGFHFFLPVSIAATVSYLTVKTVAPNSRFRAALHDDILAINRKK